MIVVEGMQNAGAGHDDAPWRDFGDGLARAVSLVGSAAATSPGAIEFVADMTAGHDIVVVRPDADRRAQPVMVTAASSGSVFMLTSAKAG
jgi:hypothetical protein